VSSFSAKLITRAEMVMWVTLNMKHD